MNLMFQRRSTRRMSRTNNNAGNAGTVVTLQTLIQEELGSNGGRVTEHPD
jgi:hypothetical protein